MSKESEKTRFCADQEAIWVVNQDSILKYDKESGQWAPTVLQREPGHYFSSHHTLYRAYQDKIYDRDSEIVCTIPADISVEDEQHGDKEFFISQDKKYLFIFQRKREQLIATRRSLDASDSITLEIEGISKPQFGKNFIVEQSSSQIIFVKDATMYAFFFETKQVSKLFEVLKDSESPPKLVYIYQESASKYLVGIEAGEIAFVNTNTPSIDLCKWHTSSIVSIIQVEADAFLITSERGVISLFNRSSGTVTYVRSFRDKLLKSLQLPSGTNVYFTADIIIFIDPSIKSYAEIYGYLPSRKVIKTEKVTEDTEENIYTPSFDNREKVPENVIHKYDDDIILEDGIIALYESIVRVISSENVIYRSFSMNARIQDIFMHKNYLVAAIREEDLRAANEERSPDPTKKELMFPLYKFAKGRLLILSEHLNDPYNQEETMEIAQIREVAKDFISAAQHESEKESPSDE